MKYKKLIISLLAAGVIIGALIVWALSAVNVGQVLKIDNSPVYTEEFEMLLRENLLKYDSELRTMLKVPEQQTVKQFVNGEEAYADLILTQHVKELKAIRARQSLAYTEKVIPYSFTYKKLIKEMEDENKQRREKISNNEVVYGLQSFDIQQYYSYYMDIIMQKTIKAMQNKKLSVESEKTEAYYKTLTVPMMFDNERFFYVLYDITPLRHEGEEKLLQAVRLIEKQLADKSYNDIEHNGITLSAQKHEWSPSQLREFIGKSTEAETVLLSLEEGGISQAFSNGSSFYIAQYNGFTKASVINDNEKGVLQNQMRRAMYFELADLQANNAKVVINKKLALEIVSKHL